MLNIKVIIILLLKNYQDRNLNDVKNFKYRNESLPAVRFRKN